MIHGISRVLVFTKPSHWTNIYLQEFRNAQKASLTDVQSIVKKYSLTQGYNTSQALSIYVDAAFYDQTLSYAAGFVIYSPDGVMVADGHLKIKPPGTIMVAELQAIYHGVLFGISNTEGPWRIFSDSVDAIHAIRSRKSYKGVEEAIIQEIKLQFRNSSVEGV